MPVQDRGFRDAQAMTLADMGLEHPASNESLADEPLAEAALDLDQLHVVAGKTRASRLNCLREKGPRGSWPATTTPSNRRSADCPFHGSLSQCVLPRQTSG